MGWAGSMVVSVADLTSPVLCVVTGAELGGRIGVGVSWFHWIVLILVRILGGSLCLLEHVDRLGTQRIICYKVLPGVSQKFDT